MSRFLIRCLAELCCWVDRAREARLKKLEGGHIALGHWGEDRAHRYLQRKGYAVLARNWRYRPESGEIDLIAYKDDVLVFAEVKTRKAQQAAEPLQQVTRQQQWRIRSAAEKYVERFPDQAKGLRFDVITVAHDPARPNRVVNIEHMVNAFDPFAS